MNPRSGHRQQVECSICGRSVSAYGLQQHAEAKHPGHQAVAVKTKGRSGARNRKKIYSCSACHDLTNGCPKCRGNRSTPKAEASPAVGNALWTASHEVPRSKPADSVDCPVCVGTNPDCWKCGGEIYKEPLPTSTPRRVEVGFNPVSLPSPAPPAAPKQASDAVRCVWCLKVMPVSEVSQHVRAVHQGGASPNGAAKGRMPLPKPARKDPAQAKQKRRPPSPDAGARRNLPTPPTPERRPGELLAQARIVKGGRSPGPAKSPRNPGNPSSATVSCGQCGRAVKRTGLPDHMRAMHPPPQGVELRKAELQTPAKSSGARPWKPREEPEDSMLRGTPKSGGPKSALGVAFERTGLTSDHRDGARGWHILRDEEGRLGSYPLHEPLDDESGPE